jgi:hypothetical protein
MQLSGMETLNTQTATLHFAPPGDNRVGTAQRRAAKDVHALAEVLERRIAGEVRFDQGSRALYATDASN